MGQLNIKTLKLKDGSEISVKDVFGVSIIAAKKKRHMTGFGNRTGSDCEK